VRSALRDLPPALARPPSRRPAPRLAFLRRTSEVTFRRYLCRYDLSQGGVSFRVIAELERAERRGQPIPEDVAPRRAVAPVRGEDAVQKAVARMYEAIHDK